MTAHAVFIKTLNLIKRNKTMKFLNIVTLTSTLLFANTPSFAIPVNINTADATTISSSLNGVGIVKANAIVDYRKNNGNFSSPENMASVKGIGVKTVEKNKKDILL